ncbi:hypothetical protein Droror1_Dr00022633 [Drosera rotundifolia]
MLGEEALLPDEKLAIEGESKIDGDTVVGDGRPGGGMGGSGKTTIARKLYKDERVKQRFQCQAWVSVSQEWNAEVILQEILRQTSGKKQSAGENWSIEELMEKLGQFLENNLFLIVLDDVWKKEALEDMLPAFPT